MDVKKFKETCEREEKKFEKRDTIEEKEEQYWSTRSRGYTKYGCDISGSLTDSHVKVSTLTLPQSNQFFFWWEFC